ncbi:hypothetical protein GCM10025869_10920 [Homoserinibacter gongjuensis]|uniref:Uncharacterized protein n=1 Tax=Homoserinibacter gongjuensis TaxID=1162968 RepID=A0ABQ6JR39_9MICO|nr:hypothetical protein GCM10025869_10920 [Homoserinibacter gongjuensis]
MPSAARLARRRTLVGIALAVLLVVATIVSAVVGQFGVSVQEVVLSFLHGTWIPNPWVPNPGPRSTRQRMPRCGSSAFLAS